MVKKTRTRILPKRNDSLFDGWSIVHMLTGVAMGWVMPPFTALVIMVLWEPFEVFVLSPILWKLGILFGHETIRNSLSDIVFDAIGVAIGAFLLAKLITAPIQLF